MKQTVTSIFFVTMFLLNAKAQKYSLIIHESEASCNWYSIEDEQGKEVTLIPEIKKTLECPSVICLKNNILITYVNNSIVWYNVESKKAEVLVNLYADIDGVSNPVWSPNGKKMMFTVINQQKKYGYTEMARILVLNINSNGKVISKQKFDRPVHFSCGSICISIPENDFRFKDDNNIEYRRHELIDNRPGEWDTILLK